MGKREYVISNLMNEDFMEHFSSGVQLEEMEESGRTILQVAAADEELLVIRNVDQKKTEFQFLRSDKELSMFKRVDHIIFEKREDDKWNLHLIEMKSSMASDKWNDVKGKFRASYLLAQSIAAMLEISIDETILYTTYENVSFGYSETMPATRRPGTGRRPFRLEWENGIVGLNFGTILNLRHKAIHVERKSNVLYGRMELKG